MVCISTFLSFDGELPPFTTVYRTMIQQISEWCPSDAQVTMNHDLCDIDVMMLNGPTFYKHTSKSLSHLSVYLSTLTMPGK